MNKNKVRANNFFRFAVCRLHDILLEDETDKEELVSVLTDLLMYKLFSGEDIAIHKYKESLSLDAILVILDTDDFSSIHPKLLGILESLIELYDIQREYTYHLRRTLSEVLIQIP
jgi:hypothetical protein